MSIDQFVPMWRLTERIVRSGLVMAWRLATSPTSTSPFFAKATTDGVVRAAFGVGDDDGVAGLEHRDHRVRRSEVDTDSLRHSLAPVPFEQPERAADLGLPDGARPFSGRHSTGRAGPAVNRRAQSNIKPKRVRLRFIPGRTVRRPGLLLGERWVLTRSRYIAIVLLVRTTTHKEHHE